MDQRQKLLITGVSGLLGSNLARHLAERYDITGIYHEYEPLIPGIKLIQADLSKVGAFESEAFDEYSTDFIIHCAGEANVDICERDPDHAERHILRMTKSVSQFARKHDAHLISISTDAVSDGSKGCLKESDTLNPINVYGRVKLRTEQYLTSEHDSSMVVRTRFYGRSLANKTSFTEHLIEELSQGRKVACFADNYCSHIYVLNLAEVLAECMGKRLFGIFNIVEDRKYSRLDFAQLLARVFGFEEKLIVSSNMTDVRSDVPRPFDTSLSNTRIKEIIKTEILPAAEGLAKMKKDMGR